MYVYADEPVCNKKTYGETRYILKSSAPILDLEGLKQDYGSFKGWMTLNLRKTGKDQTDEADRLNFEIYDPKYPPKIPRSAWANDDRNKRWADLLPPEPKPVADGTASLIEGARFYKEIRDEVKGEMPDDQAPNSTRETLETMKLAKELFGPSNGHTPAVQDSPLKIAVELATTMMQMKADNPVIDMYRDELKAMREELKEAHAEMRKSQSAPAKSGFDQLMEIATSAEKLEPFKKLFGGLFGNGNGSVGSEGIIRTARTTGLDVLRDFVTSPVAEKIGAGLGDLFSRMADAPPQPVTIPLTPTVVNGDAAPRPQPSVQRETDQQRIIRIAQTITGPMLDEFFDQDEPGDLFAEKVFDFWPADLKFLQGLGAERILNLYRGFAPAWARIGPKEQQFAQFLKEFCEWKPEVDDESAPPDDGIVDLEPEGQKGATA
jgi:hypothetical protein